jgi:pyrimidine operon attenuation protein/uracil phosphoribosyltransferase
MKTNLLDHWDIVQKTKRIAFQIVEGNFDEKEIILVGIVPNGLIFSEMIKEEISSINERIKVSILPLTINKATPLADKIEIDTTQKSITNKTIIIVDDVANTGRTVFFALQPIIALNPKKVQVAVLVDRKHKHFPIAADYVGMSLSTTLQEHILVDLQPTKAEAYLV